MSLAVLRNPCASCPYRVDHPSGVWVEEEYEKLRRYATNESFGTFLCHLSPVLGDETVCRGWLSVECESAAARLAVGRGEVNPDDLYEPCSVPLYPSGAAAADAGEERIRNPGARARTMTERLARQGFARDDNDGEPVDSSETCNTVGDGCLAPAGYRDADGSIRVGTVAAANRCTQCEEPVCDACVSPDGLCGDCAA